MTIDGMAPRHISKLSPARLFPLPKLCVAKRRHSRRQRRLLFSSPVGIVINMFAAAICIFRSDRRLSCQEIDRLMRNPIIDPDTW